MSNFKTTYCPNCFGNGRFITYDGMFILSETKCRICKGDGLSEDERFLRDKQDLEKKSQRAELAADEAWERNRK